jgi:hypothetical protein
MRRIINDKSQRRDGARQLGQIRAIGKISPDEGESRKPDMGEV